MGSFELFPHDADIGVRGRGSTLGAAFAQAARALTAVATDPSSVREVDALEISCRADDPEILLFDWLNALVFEMSTRDMLFARHEVEVEGDRLRARVFGEPVDGGRHRPAVEVKGATMTGLRVAREGDGTWVAECVVDV
jgi:SHS2 domain-containing protein